MMILNQQLSVDGKQEAPYLPSPLTARPPSLRFPASRTNLADWPLEVKVGIEERIGGGEASKIFDILCAFGFAVPATAGARSLIA